MKQFSVKMIMFLGLSFVMLYGIDRFYTNYIITHPNVCEKSEWILNHGGETFGFAFLGNSRVMSMVDINLVEQRTGQKGINLGLMGANFAECYMMLDQFIKRQNKIRNLIVEVDMHNLNSRKQLNYPFHDLNYVSLLEDSTVFSVFKDNVPSYKLVLWKYVPFLRYMEFSSRFVLYKMIKGGFECKTSALYESSKGSDVVTEKVLKDSIFNYVYWTADKSDEKYLNRIIEFAKQKNINLIFYSAPVYSKYMPYQLNYEKMINDVKLRAQQIGIPFLNFSEPKNPLCRNLDDFNDSFHMNVKGVKKLSTALADSLKPIFK